MTFFKCDPGNDELQLPTGNTSFMTVSNYMVNCKLTKSVLYLIEGKGTDAVSGQLHGVQHGDLDHPIGLRSSRRPVLVTLHLAEQKRERGAHCQGVNRR